MTEDEMVGWHHQLNGHESEQAPGDGERQGSLTCCSPWGHKELDMTERLLLSFFSLMSQFFASGGQSIGASVSASVLRNIQG